MPRKQSHKAEIRWMIPTHLRDAFNSTNFERDGMKSWSQLVWIVCCDNTFLTVYRASWSYVEDEKRNYIFLPSSVFLQKFLSPCADNILFFIHFFIITCREHSALFDHCLKQTRQYIHSYVKFCLKCLEETHNATGAIVTATTKNGFVLNSGPVYLRRLWLMVLTLFQTWNRSCIPCAVL